MMKINFEKIFFILLGITFFIGIWHAFPMLNIVNDEMYFVGGVLRAVEHHTIVPLVDDVPYGTLTYLLNYPMTIVTLVVMFPFFHFSISALKLFLIQSPDLMYLSLRFLSVLLSLVILFIVNKILKKEIEDKKTRLFLIVLLFTNIITTVILHTGKVWVLSILLVLCSFYYLYKAVADKAEVYKDKLKKHIFLSILFSFLAVSNFPLFIFSLVNIPLFLFFFRKDKELLKSIVKYVVVGFIVFALIILFNFEGIRNQLGTVNTDFHSAGGNIIKIISILINSVTVYSKKLMMLFPLTILTLLFVVKNKIRNLSLFIISLAYFFAYSSVALVVAFWPAGDLSLLLRYMFPLGFFLIFIIASFNIKFKKAFYVIAGVSLIYYIFTLYYLSIPTTYNQTYNWVNNSLGDKKVLIINSVQELDLKKNKESSLLIRKISCATKCQNIINFDLNKNFQFVVLDKESEYFDFSKLRNDIYYVRDSVATSTSLVLIESYVNSSKTRHTIDYNMGNYLDLSYFRIKNLGSDIYIYKYDKQK